MAVNAVTTTVYSDRSLAVVGASIEAALEAIEEARVIRLCQIFREENGVYTAILMTDDA